MPDNTALTAKAILPQSKNLKTSSFDGWGILITCFTRQGLAQAQLIIRLSGVQ
jgi:hypothetical protein